MPVMDEQFSQLCGICYFTTLDLRMGFHQFQIEESSKSFTTFVITEGYFKYNMVPFGFVNAPAVFQAVMYRILEFMDRGKLLAYLDNVVIPSKVVEESVHRLD